MNRRMFFETIAGAAFTVSASGHRVPRNIMHLSPVDMSEHGSRIADGLLNANSRRYPRETWERMEASMGRLWIVNAACDYVELGDSVGTRVSLMVDRVAARITNFYIEEAAGPEEFSVYADVAMLHTPPGSIAKNLIRSGKRLYLTPVGMGVVSDDGTVTEYDLNHWALVDNSAFLSAQPILLRTEIL